MRFKSAVAKGFASKRFEVFTLQALIFVVVLNCFLKLPIWLTHSFPFSIFVFNVWKGFAFWLWLFLICMFDFLLQFLQDKIVMIVKTITINKWCNAILQYRPSNYNLNSKSICLKHVSLIFNYYITEEHILR